MCFHQKFIITKIYKDLDSRMGFVVCGKPHVTFLIIRALYVFSASTYDAISHLIPITSMSAEVVDGGRCLFYFNIYFFSFNYLHIPGGEWGRRGEHPKRTRIPRNAVSRLPALFHKIEVNLRT